MASGRPTSDTQVLRHLGAGIAGFSAAKVLRGHRDCQVHHWRYARPRVLHSAPRLTGAHVEGAYLSGRIAVEAILDGVGSE